MRFLPTILLAITVAGCGQTKRTDAVEATNAPSPEAPRATAVTASPADVGASSAPAALTVKQPAPAMHVGSAEEPSAADAGLSVRAGSVSVRTGPSGAASVKAGGVKVDTDGDGRPVVVVPGLGTIKTN